MINNFLEAVHKRKSVRSYSNKEISKNTLSEIEKFIKTIPTINGNKIDFTMFKDGDYNLELTMPAGMFIKNSPYYFTCHANENNNYLIEAGYQSEYLVLFLTHLDIGTCYIGGMVDFNKLEKEMKLKDNEKILILTTMGYPEKGIMGFMTDTLVETGKLFLGIHKRKDFEEIVFYKKWGNNADNYLDNNENVKVMINAARVSPSWCNLQPWRFIIDDDKISLFAGSSSKDDLMNYKNSWGRDYRNFDIGIAMSHFEIAAKTLNVKGKWQFPDKENEYEVPEGNALIAEWKFINNT